MGLLDGQIASLVGNALDGAGLLLSGTLRREGETSVNTYGDPVPGTTETYDFKAFDDQRSDAYRAQAGVPDTDVFIAVAANSCEVVPAVDDLLQFRDVWHRARRVTTDPARAMYVVQAFKVADPT